MFNLVRKRYIFLIISLIVIIPGTISLIFKGFDVGIDFAGGSSLEFRPAQHVTSTEQVINLLDKLGLKDVQVNIGNDTSTPKDHVAWIKLSTDITSDTTLQNTIKDALQKKFGNNLSSVSFDPLSLTPSGGGKATTVTVITLTNKSAAFNAKTFESDVKAALGNNLKTTPASTSTASPTPTPTQPASPALTATATVKPTATAAPTATPTATSTATGTPTATPTATSTPTTSNPAATVPVTVKDAQVGTTTDTINILTTTTTTTASVREIQAAFLNQHGNYLYSMSNSSVSSSVASATIRNSILAVLAASALILLYVWFAFRKVNKPWRYGACAIIALLHDVLVVMGVFSILGWTLHVQIDALFITALLTVVGFSVHDTIVVFDRIRENMQRRSSETFEQIVNASLVQTMSRSLNTSLTVLFTLSALTLFGGESIRSFTFALLIGIFSGTYSSIFNASMLLVIWERGELGLSRLNRDNRRGSNGRNRRQARERELAKSRG